MAMAAIHDRRADAVARLNDEHRAYPGPGWSVSAGLAALGPVVVGAATSAVKTFDAFETELDPRSEHAAGALEVLGQRLVWTIAYYDLNYAGASPNPADPRVTRRLLRVMLADEHRPGGEAVR